MADPTPAQIEAAARAAFIADAESVGPDYAAQMWAQHPDGHAVKRYWRKVARAALTAAAQAGCGHERCADLAVDKFSPCRQPAPDPSVHHVNGRCVLDSCPGPHYGDPQPAPEADERQALDALYRLTSTAVFVGTDYPVTVVAWSDVLGWWAMRPSPQATQTHPVVTAERVAKATRDACVEAGWDWSGEPSAGIPSPEHQMRPVVLAALATLGITVEAPCHGEGKVTT